MPEAAAAGSGRARLAFAEAADEGPARHGEHVLRLRAVVEKRARAVAAEEAVRRRRLAPQLARTRDELEGERVARPHTNLLRVAGSRHEALGRGRRPLAAPVVLPQAGAKEPAPRGHEPVGEHAK